MPAEYTEVKIHKCDAVRIPLLRDQPVASRNKTVPAKRQVTTQSDRVGTTVLEVTASLKH